MKFILSWNQFKKIVRRNFLLVIVLTIVGFAAGYGVAKFVMKPKYEASTSVVINSEKRTANQTVADALDNNQADNQMLNTYKDMLTKPDILDRVVTNLGTQKRLTPSEVKMSKSVNIDNTAGSRVFTIRVETANPKVSAMVANGLVSEFNRIIPTMLTDARPVTVVSKATSKIKENSQTKTFALGGAVLGLVIGFYLVSVREVFDPRIVSLGYFKSKHVPVLGQIKHF